ncbi:MAG: type II secretion system protein GspG [Phycisphaerales bacterium]
MITPRPRGLARAARRRHSRPGFSLLEITLVLVIIGMMMAVAAVSLLGNAKRASIKTTKISMTTIQSAIKNYMLEHAGTPPASLNVLVTDDYLENKALKDSWDQPFYYTLNSADQLHPYQLISNGPDKQPGTEDDINIWTMDQKN